MVRWLKRLTDRDEVSSRLSGRAWEQGYEL